MTLRHTIGMFAVIVALGAQAALADTTTANSPTAANPPTTTSSTTLTAPAPAKQPSTILTISPSESWAVGGVDGYGNNANFANSRIRLGGNLTQRIGNRWTVVLQRSYYDFTFGQVTNYKGAYIDPAYSEDAINNAHVSYAMGPVTLSGGYQQRIRQCCPSATGSAANPATYHFWYVQADTRLGPYSKLGRWFGISLQDAQVPHSTSPYFPDPNYAPGSGHFIASQGPKNKLTYNFNVTVPVDKAQTLGAFVTYANAWDYFLSSPEIYLYNSLSYGIKKNFSKRLTYTATITSLYQHKQDYPFAYPNVLNRTTLMMNWDYKLPLF